MISSQDKEALLSWHEKIPSKIDLILQISDDKTRSRPLEEFCETLTSLLPNFVIQKQKTEGDQMPSIRLGDRLRYSAVPLGPELAPFMEAAILQEEGPQRLPDSIHKLVAELDMPAMLKLYISPQCPFCPDAARTLLQLPIACEQVQLSIIDGTLFSEMAGSDGIKSAPTVVLDEFRWTGSIRLEEIVQMILSRDPSELSSSTVRSLIEEGSASQVAQLMLQHQIIFPGFIDSLTDEKWAVRLGAMVAAEEIAEHDPILASQVIAPLEDRLDSLEETAKGDVIYIMGEAGTADTISVLERVLNEAPGEEIKTVAQEAIERILERMK